MRRLFNAYERSRLFIRAGGKCQLCGVLLRKGWHADHVNPFSNGGPTAIHNGQALCESCNLRKGAKVNNPRDWQVKALNVMQTKAREGGRDFLAAATPGAGKTRFAIECIKYFRDIGEIDRVVIVCYSQRMKSQWAASCSQHGLHISINWSNGDGLEDFQKGYIGNATTYHSIGRCPEQQRINCINKRTLVILDEVHHAGDANSWGDSLYRAFGDARFRLSLSGTPFRSDNARIPFITYNERGESVADYVYSYEDALSDGDVVRSLWFPSVGTNAEWVRDGEIFRASFDDDVDKQGESDRLRTTLKPELSWFRSVMNEADNELRRDRASIKRDAAGLVVCMDTNHANAVAKVVKQITGEMPAIAHSEQDTSSYVIDEFALNRDNSQSRWIVAVKMVSEGVDIPRLTKLVYASNTVSPLYFAQVVGRVARGPKTELGKIWIPSDQRLVSHALQFMEQRCHVIKESMSEAQDRERRKQPERNSEWSAIGATAEGVGVIGNKSQWPSDVAADAEAVSHKWGVDFDKSLEIAQYFKSPNRSVAVIEKPMFKQEEELRAEVNRHAKIVTRKLFPNPTSEHYQLVHRALQAKTGKGISQCSVEELRVRVEILKGWIAIPSEVYKYAQLA